MLNSTSSVLLQTMLLLLNKNLQHTENTNDLQRGKNTDSKLYVFKYIKV